MASRYWVGGTGSWDTTTTTNWSASSGGGGGASVPTVADDVFFDQAGTYTVTMTGALTCLDITVSAGTVTFAQGTSPTLNIAGSMSLVAGTVWSSTANITFSSTTTGRTVTTNGVSVSAGNFIFNGIGGEWTLGSALTLPTGNVQVLAGSFSTSATGYAVNLGGQLFLNSSSVRSVNLNNSIVAIGSNSASAFTANPITNLTFNAGTSQINFTGSTSGINGGLTFYNVAFTSAAGVLRQIVGSNTFNNLAFTASSAAGAITTFFYSRQTINGVLSTTGTAGNRRVLFRSDTAGIAYTLTINGTPSLTDVDFQDLYIIGTAAPIFGTRLGNRGGTSGITFTSKTVYWATAAGGDWSGTNWATSAGGAVSTDNFPLPQDTATIVNTGLNTSAIISFNGALSTLAVSGIDMSGRTNAMALDCFSISSIYGDWKNGSGTSITNGGAITFAGRNTQTITSAGKAFTSSLFYIDSIGGTVQLADALNIGTGQLTITNGTFTTNGYAVTAGNLSSSNSNVRSINLGASTLTLSSGTSVDFSISTNLTLNAGTSQITASAVTTAIFGGGLTFYNVTTTGSGGGSVTISGNNTFNNVTITPIASSGVSNFFVAANQTINGTLTIAGATAVRRIFARSDTTGTARTLTVNSLVATDCDFCDITITGAAAGTAPTRAGDCGGNTGITFPAAKTVYWNLAGAQYWSSTAWCSSSGGTPDINQFPLAQDTAVFDNTGSAGAVTINIANISAINASARTSAMSLTLSGSNIFIYGDLTLGTGVSTLSSPYSLYFLKNSTKTITSNGVQFIFGVFSSQGTLQLADAFSSATIFGFGGTTSTLDAKTYNVTCANFTNGSLTNTLKMGSGTWTLTGTAWNLATAPILYCGTANIVLSDNSTTARTFAGGGLVYNKLTIGGATSTSTTTITGNNTFSELASTKTVAHTIALGTTTQTFGAWTVTGTFGNVVTVSGTATITIAGSRVSGVDYFALGTTTVSATSPGEFYAGANSTGGTNFILTSAPAGATRYWVGGSGTWDATTTTNWSATSGGSGGASVPTSAEDVIFDSASSATAYTVTCTATQLRCALLSFSGPASGNVTWAGAAPLVIQNNFTLPATGLTRTYTGAITFSRSFAATRTITTNGVTLASLITINGIGSSWILGSALNIGASTLTITNGSFDTGNYSVTADVLTSSGLSNRTIAFGSSTITLNNGSGLQFGNVLTQPTLNLNAGTSTITLTADGASFYGGGKTFYNVLFTGVTSTGGFLLQGSNTFNNLTYSGRTTQGTFGIVVYANQIINGTLRFLAGTDATRRNFVRTDALGTTRTLTCAAFSGTDVDFRDIAIVGATNSNVPLLLKSTSTNAQTNNTFLDSSTNNFTITPAGTPTQGSITPYWPDGYWSNYFNGTSDYLSTPTSTALDFGAGDFTIEAWVNIQSNTTDYFIISATGSGGLFLGYSQGTTSYGWGRNAITWDYTTTGATRVIGTWQHIAIVRSGTSGGTVAGPMKLYINGTPIGAGLTTSQAYNLSTTACSIGSQGTTYYINGNISNLRVIKGQALITGSGSFMVPTSPLTSTTVGWSGTNVASGISGTVSLLTCQSNRFKDNSTNNFTITANSTPKVQSFQPFNLATSYSAAAYGGSGYFNGSTDYLTRAFTSTTDGMYLQGSTYTIEAWVCPQNLSGTQYIYICNAANVASFGYTTLYLSGTTVGFATRASTSGTEYFVTGGSLTNNQWAHIAFSVNSTVGKLFLNGVQVGSNLTIPAANTFTPTGAGIGFTQNGYVAGISYFSGYISNLRITQSTAVYTAAFTPPTAPVTAITNTNLLLNFTNAGIYDVTAQSNISTVGSTQISTAQSKWAPTSMLFNGTTDYLNLGSNQAFVLSSGDWTMESWVYPTSSNVGHWIFLQGNTSGYAAIRAGCQSSQAFLLISTNGSSWTVTSGLVGSVPLNTWSHLAITRSGSTITLYINGTSAYTSTALSTSSLMTGTYNLIGRIDPTNQQYFTGYIQETKLTKAVQYTANFTPSTTFTTPISGTRLGDCQGNTGITFPAGTNKYWNLLAGGNWQDTAWATSSGGSLLVNNFPLAQDTAIFENTGLNSAAAVSYNINYNVGTINMSARSSPMTLNLFQVVNLHGNWINGAGVSLVGLGYGHQTLGRGNQTITSAGKAFPDNISINSIGGSFELQDALILNRASASLTLNYGTFNSNGYSVTLSDANSSFGSSSSTVRTINFGSNNAWTLGGNWSVTSTNLTITGTGTLNFTSAAAKTFSGGGASYPGITVNQAGAGTLTFSGNNIVKDITNTYGTTGATTINLSSAIQTVSQFTATGTTGKLLTLLGASAAGPATLILTGATKPSFDYVNLTYIRAYPITDTWSAGANSVNNGSLGVAFASGTTAGSTSKFLLLFS